jgi:Na+/proline symporter
VVLLYPRIRQIGNKRSYDSPTDIIGDRFDCNSLRLVSAFTFVIPLFIYTTVQFKSIMEIIQTLSLGRIDRNAVAVLVCAVIIVCEWVGGQRSVTLSDSMQASIMLLAFMIMPFVVASIHGSMASIMDDGCTVLGFSTEFSTRGCH